MVGISPAPAQRPPRPAPSSALLQPVFLLLALAAILIWTGIGSIRIRRWTRPVIVALSSVMLPLIHLGLSRRPRTRGRVVHLLLLYALVLDVGVIGLPLGFIPHVFFPDQAAELIGWPPGSPFQLEVGFHDGAWGLLGFLCIWIGGLFWLATGLGWSFFMLGATYGHIRETVIREDYAPYNFFTMFSDGFIGIWILVLLYLYYRQGGFQK